jgi:hypothetical protein
MLLKQTNEVIKMTQLTFIAGKGYGADVIVDGNKFYYSELSEANKNLYIVSEMLGNFFDYQHCQIALDAGGEIVESETNKWGETILKKVSVESDKMIAYCEKLKAARNPHAGMMQTSTGEWVMADDWDIIEGSR